MRLTTASWWLVGGFIVHNADHARRGLEVVDEGVVWGGTIVAMLLAVMLTLVAVRHDAAPAVAAVGAFTIVFGVAASHLLPEWGPLSDPLPGGDVDAATWIAVLAEITGAGLVGVVALRILRRNDYAFAITGWR
jgi:hypothetical protein